MAEFPVQNTTAPTSVESFVADRQSMWARFNRLTATALGAVVVVLFLMWLFLV